MDVEPSVSVIASTSSLANEKNEDKINEKSGYNMRSTRRSLSRSSTITSTSSSSSTSSTISTKNTIKTRNRVKLKKESNLKEEQEEEKKGEKEKEKEEEENKLINNVKFELGSISSESIQSATSMNGKLETEEDQDQDQEQNDNEHKEHEESENENEKDKNKKTKSKRLSASSRKSLQLINNKSSNLQSSTIKKQNKNVKTRKKSLINIIEEESNSLTNSLNDNTTIKQEEKKLINNLDENTQDCFNIGLNNKENKNLDFKNSNFKNNLNNNCLKNDSLTNINKNNINNSNNNSNNSNSNSNSNSNANNVNSNNSLNLTTNNNDSQMNDDETTNVEVDIEGEYSSSNLQNDNTQNSIEKNTNKNINNENSNDNCTKQEENSQSNLSNANNNNSNNNNNNSNNVKVPKKKGRKKASLMPNSNIDDLKNSNSLETKLFIYKWPEESDNEEEETDNKKSSNNKPESIDNNNMDSDLHEDEVLSKKEKFTRLIFSSKTEDLYILQEQVSEYLEIKSFKRKYPDIYRRFLDIKEREFLKKHKVVTETQCDLGLTALKLSECFDLMADDYPEKYKEFNDYFNERRRRALQAVAFQAASISLNKRKSESIANPKTPRAPLSEADRMKELIKKAMKSVASYNSQLQKEKQEERQTFYDLQTMRIQTVKKQIETSDVKYINNKNGQYPVALLPGQFQYYYKDYSPDELKYLPVDTVIYQPPVPTNLEYHEWKKQLLKPAQINSQITSITSAPSSTTTTTTTTLANLLPQSTIAQSLNSNSSLSTTSTARKLIEIKPAQKYANTSEDEDEKMDFTQSKPVEIAPKATTSSNQLGTIKITASAAPTVAKLINSSHKTCYICQKGSLLSTSSNHIDNNQIMISCSSCPRYSHPNCLELNPKLVDWTCIRNYDWQCMECKKCSKCHNPNDEDKMMFCDRCDRGFHTYCVGMSQVPNGTWLCKSCTEFNDKLNAIQEKINNSKQQVQQQQQHQHQHQQQLNGSTPTKLQLKLKLNNSINSNTTTPVSTPTERRGRGRPPGSLNKPKDPNSPKKQYKTPKPAKIRDSLLINNLNNNLNSNSNNSLIINQSINNYQDTFNDSLSYENSYEQQYGSYTIQYGSNVNQATSFAGNTNTSNNFYHLDETSTNSQYHF